MDDPIKARVPASGPEGARRDLADAGPPGAAELIDGLMAGPIKSRPAVTILGDDVVTGFNPPRTEDPSQG